MACCEIMYGSGVPVAPPAESHIPIYIDRTSKKVYYWNGTGWELIWEIATAGPGTPGVVSIDPNSPIKLGGDGTLQIDCLRLKQQCGFATADEVASVVTTTVNNLIQDIVGDITNLETRVTNLETDVTNLETTVTQIDQAVDSLTTRVTNIENWDLCDKTSDCGYDSGGGGVVAGVTKLIAGANITLNPPSGVGDVTISAAGGGGGGGTAGVTKVTSASAGLVVTPSNGVGNVVLTLLGGGDVTGDADNGYADVGDIRFQWGLFTTTTGNLDTITMTYPFGAKPYVLVAMERNAVGWTGSGPNNPMPTVYGTAPHPTTPATKFLVSVVRVLNAENAAAVGQPTKYEIAGGQWFGVGSKP